MFSYKPLWKLLIDRGIKKRDLVPLANISRSTLYHLDCGDRVSLDVLDKLCTVLNCQIEDILEHSAEKKNQPKRQQNSIDSESLADMIYLKELNKSFPITDSVKKALTLEGYDFYSLPLKIKLQMLDPLNIGIYNKEGQMIDTSEDDWDIYTEEDFEKMRKNKIDYQERLLERKRKYGTEHWRYVDCRKISI